MLLILSLLIWAGVARWTEQAGGLQGARSFAAALVAGLLAMRFFDSLAAGLETALPAAAGEADCLALLLVFWGGYLALGWLAEQSLPEFDLDSRVAKLSRYAFAGLTGYVVLAVQLTALHASPFAQARLGYRPGARYFLGVSAPEMQWLYFVDLVNRRALATQSLAPGTTAPGQAAVNRSAGAGSPPAAARAVDRRPVGATSLIRGARLTTQRLAAREAAAGASAAVRASPVVVDVVFTDEPAPARLPGTGIRSAVPEKTLPVAVQEAASADSSTPPARAPAVPTGAQLSAEQKSQLIEALRKLKSSQENFTAERPPSGRAAAEQELDQLEQLLKDLQSAGPGGGGGAPSFEEILEQIRRQPATDRPATEKPATEKPATEKPATEKPATEKPATEKPPAEPR